MDSQSINLLQMALEAWHTTVPLGLASILCVGIVIERVITHADETWVTSVWNMVAMKKDDLRMCGIEVFKVEDGRLAHCWNTPYANGVWG